MRETPGFCFKRRTQRRESREARTRSCELLLQFLVDFSAFLPIRRMGFDEAASGPSRATATTNINGPAPESDVCCSDGKHFGDFWLSVSLEGVARFI